MKIGIRKPSIKKSIKARTTGYVKRKVKKGLSPIYGIKGTGLIKSPKRAIYGKIYNKTTITIFDNSFSSKRKYHSNSKNNNTTIINFIKLIIEKRKIISSKRNSIPKSKRTNYFSIKAQCFICNINLGLITLKGRYQLIDGWLCMKCFKKIFGKNYPLKFRIYTQEDISSMLHKYKE